MGAIRIKRRSSSGSTGSPSTLLNAELAYNEADNTLYYGYGDNGSGGATSVVSIAGQGAYATLNTAQTITGNKVFSGNLTYTGSVDSNANNTQVATTGWVQNRIASSAYSLPAATTSTLGGIIVGDNLSVDANGVLSGVNSYTLPAATTSTLGGVIVGDGVSVNNGTISVNTNYLPLLANTTSNSTIPIKSTTGSNQTVSGISFAGSGLGQPYTGVSGFASTGSYIAETYKGTDATAANQFGTLAVGFSAVNLLSRALDVGSMHGFESQGSVATGTRMTNKDSLGRTGLIVTKQYTTDYPYAITGTGVTTSLHAGTGTELTADSMNLGICANATHGTAELRFGANLTAVRNANSILTQGYADTRYLQNASLTGTVFESFTPNGNGFVLAEANATNGMLIGNIEFPGYSKYRGTMVSENDAFKTVGLIDGTPQIGWASATGTMALEVTSSDVRIEDTTGSKTWESRSILTRGYADSRYLQSTGTGSIGDLTVTGNLTVQGTTTTLNTDTLVVEDKNIVIANVTSPTDVTADGGGLTLLGTTNKTFNWYDATDAWTSSEHFDLANGKQYKINNVAVLTASGLGSSVVSSSLTSVGTISSGTWQGNAIGVAYGGTGATTITGIVKGNGSNPMTAATAGTDYLAPNSTIDGGTF